MQQLLRNGVKSLPLSVVQRLQEEGEKIVPVRANFTGQDIDRLIGGLGTETRFSGGLQPGQAENHHARSEKEDQKHGYFCDKGRNIPPGCFDRTHLHSPLRKHQVGKGSRFAASLRYFLCKNYFVVTFSVQRVLISSRLR